ncbi:MAG: 2,3-bisphosphoglycerate-independent phosphoglycerate mutase [Candidatus Aminicenantales bacterium]
MDWEKIAKDLSVATESKIVLLVIDGLGGVPVNGKTELEAARSPHLDSLAAKGICGLTDPVFMGITPGSGPAHLALFGYDPLKYQLGRGILEALGSGVEVGEGDLVARGNFATLKDELIIDRRAGRIPTDECEKLCQRLNQALKDRKGIKITLFAGKEHRFVAKFSGQGLSDALTDADPQKDHKPRVPTRPLSPEAAYTAEAVNRFLDEAVEILKGSSAANAVLLRGFSLLPLIPQMQDLYKLNPAAIANYPMYKGLARLLGMKTYDVGPETGEIFDSLEKHYQDHDFFFVHYKKTDAAGEDGNYEAKVRAIEEIDRFLPRLEALTATVLVITSDHSTPSLLKSHSWHPNPFLLISPASIPDSVASCTERECARGMLGRFQAIYAMPLMLAYAGKMRKFGA